MPMIFRSMIVDIENNFYFLSFVVHCDQQFVLCTWFKEMLRDSINKSCLSFLTVVVLAGVVFLGLFLTSIGLLDMPDEIRQAPGVVVSWNDSFQNAMKGNGSVTLSVVKNTTRSSPLDNIVEPTDVVLVLADTPIPEPIPTPVPTATPVPPLDPGVYRVETIERLKTFSDSLRRWVDYNQTLSEDVSRLGDPVWQVGMRSALAEVVAAAKSLADVGPAPREYTDIDDLLDSVSWEANSLDQNYNRAMKTGSLIDLQSAGDDFTRLKAYLKQAAEQMVAQGWDL